MLAVNVEGDNVGAKLGEDLDGAHGGGGSQEDKVAVWVWGCGGVRERARARQRSSRPQPGGTERGGVAIPVAEVQPLGVVRNLGNGLLGAGLDGAILGPCSELVDEGLLGNDAALGVLHLQLRHSAATGALDEASVELALAAVLGGLVAEPERETERVSSSWLVLSWQGGRERRQTKTQEEEEGAGLLVHGLLER